MARPSFGRFDDFDDDDDYGNNLGTESGIEADWIALGSRLGAQLRPLRREEIVEVGRTDQPPGYQMLLKFTVTGSGRVRCVIDGMPRANFADADSFSALLALCDAVVRLGWRQLRSGAYINEASKRDLDKLLEAVVRLLRDEFEVEHPLFVIVGNPTGSRPRPPQPIEQSARTIGDASEASPALGTVPRDTAHLREMAHKILTARFGNRVQLEQNVIGFSTDVGLHTNILVSPQALRLEFCTVLSHQIPDMDLLGAVIAEHSSRWPDISIVVTKGHVFAVRAMDAAVFQSGNLIAAVTAWQEFCSDGAIDIIEQLQPDPLNEFECSLFDEVPERLIDMVERYSRGDRSGLTPDEIARGCRGNTPMLRRYARICSDQIERMNLVEFASRSQGGGPEAVAGFRREREAIEQFLPVLIDSITLAAQYNGERESGRWRQD